jgi:hypothetical protein
VVIIRSDEETFSSKMLTILSHTRKMAAACLLLKVDVFRSQLFKLPAVTELSLIRWASKKAGQFSYAHTNT